MADDRRQLISQIRALSVLRDDLLRPQLSTGLLPVVRWTTDGAGAALNGTPRAVDDEGKQKCLQAWADRLGLPLEATDMGSGMSRLSVAGSYEKVRVSLGATLYGDDGGGGDRG